MNNPTDSYVSLLLCVAPLLNSQACGGQDLLTGWQSRGLPDRFRVAGDINHAPHPPAVDDQPRAGGAGLVGDVEGVDLPLSVAGNVLCPSYG